MPSARVLTTIAAILASASAFAQSAPTVEECAVRWHVPFDSELRGSCEKADDRIACATQRATIASMDLSYSACIELVETIEGDLRESSEHAYDRLIQEYRFAEDSKPRIEIDRTLVESYRPPADRMRFVHRSAGNAAEWDTGYGVIVDETPREFAALFHSPEYDHPRFELNSPGGSLRAAIRLGELIRAYGYSTAIDDEKPADPPEPSGESPSSDPPAEVPTVNIPPRCLGACAFAFMGGVTRRLGPRDVIGFADGPEVKKALAAAGEPQEPAVSREQLVDYVMRMGVDVRAVNKAAAASFHGKTLSRAEAKRLRIVFEREVFLPWQNERENDKVVARSSSLDGTLKAEIACAESGKEATFTYATKTSRIYSRRDIADSVGTFHFAGLTIGPDQLTISGDGPTIMYSSALPPDYEKTARKPRLDLTFQVDKFKASHVAESNFYIGDMTTRGFARAAAIALKSCSTKH